MHVLVSWDMGKDNFQNEYLFCTKIMSIAVFSQALLQMINEHLVWFPDVVIASAYMYQQENICSELKHSYNDIMP